MIATIDVQGFFDDPAEAVMLGDKEVSWLVKTMLVPPSAMHFAFAPWAVMCHRVLHNPETETYTPIGGAFGRGAYIFPVIVGGEIVDAAAWSPATASEPAALSVRFGVGSILGQDALEEEGAGTTGLPIPVHPDPLSWLHANRAGVVVIRWRPAAALLADRIIEVQGPTREQRLAFERELARRLIVRRPLIFNRDTAAWRSAA